MYTAIIAEDSKPILRNIKALLQSTGLPIEVVATALNGEEALESIRRRPVDILLTDIRMPKLDGLTLIERAKALHPELKVVLISGYNDFEYTRKALNLQVFDYLLKPVERHQLAEVMERMIAALGERKDRGEETFKGIVDSDHRAELALKPDFYDRPKIPFLIRLQPFAAVPDDRNRQAVHASLSDVFSPHACWVFPTGLKRQFLLLAEPSVRGKYAALADCAETVRSVLEAQGVPVSVAGRLRPVDMNRLPDFYEEASRLLDELMTISEPVLADTDAQAGRAAGRGRTSGDWERLIGDFEEMIRQRQKERYLLKLSEQLQKWPGENVRMVELGGFISAMTEAFADQWPAQEPWSRLELEEEAEQLLDAPGYESFREALLGWAEQGFELLHAQNRKSGHELFRQIDEYVRLNMYSHVSIADLALKFHVSPSYISRIIKRYTDTTFVRYYMMMKIKEACRLMEEKPDMKIKDLSDALSFSDQHYFSKVFKEYTGCSPTEYKTDRKTE